MANVPEIRCRYCGRPTALSPATGLWWPADGLLPGGLGHQPQEPDSDDDGDPAA